MHLLKLRVVIQRAIRQNTAQAVKDVMMRHASVTRRVNIDVEPLTQSKQTEGLLLVSFQEQPSPVGETLAESKTRAQAADSEMVRQLEQELDTTREDLQSTIEELESSNEELKASNEEVMSMNEALQSANEELETSKEELQSLNEELTTVNNQLHEKVQELETANNDMANLFNATDTATVFLDPGLRIKRFTPATTRLLNLIPTDVGRPLGDIVKKFTDDDLLGDAQRLLGDLAPREKEVPTEDGHWYARRIVPYRTLDDRIAGVVITFVDTTERKQAADAVVRRLAAIVESSADAIFSKDFDGTVRTWNAGAERLFGYTANEVVGRSIRLTIPDDLVEEWTQAMSRLAGGEHLEQMETERIRKGGQRIPVAVTYSPLRDGSGRIMGVSATVRDISERKRAEAALRRSEERFRVMADHAPVFIWISGTDKRCTWFNKPWLDFTGRAMEDELGDGWSRGVHAEDIDRCLATYTSHFDARSPFTMEYRLRRHDGEYRWVLDTGIPLLGAGGEFAGYIGSCIDITDRKSAEEQLQRLTVELRARVEELTTLLEILPGAVLIADPACQRITGNRAFYEMIELAPGTNASLTADRTDMPAGTRVYRDGRELPPDEFPMQATGRTGQRIMGFEHDVTFPDGRVLTLLANTAPLLDEHGSVRGVVGAYTDISERKRSETALRVSEKHLADELANMVRIHEVSTRLVRAGDATSLLLEIVDAAIAVTAADMGHIQLFDHGSGALKIVASRGFEKPFLEFFNAVHEGQATCGTALQKGERMVIEDVTASPVFVGTPALDVLLAAGVRAVESTPLVARSGRVVGMLSTHYRTPRRLADRELHALDLLARQAADWAERVQADEVLRDQEAHLRAIFETVGDSIISIDRHGIIQAANTATERMFGYAAAELVGQNVSMLMSSPHREAHDGYLERYLRTGERRMLGTRQEVEARRKDGSVFPTELSVSEIEHLGLFTGVHRDLTDRRQLERDVVEAASLEQRRIGQDLHDSVGQELTALNLLAADLAEVLKADPPAAALIAERMAQGLQRSHRELRAVLRGLLPVAIDSQGLMAALAELAERTSQGGGVSCKFDNPEPVAVADNLTATHLYLIAQEAVSNAVQHARPRNVRISLRWDGALVLSVEDDGVGIPARPAEPQGHGLRIVRNRAALIGATLTVEPRIPTGTVVTCVLGRSSHEREKGREARPGPDRR